jgi:hypothetical protein
MLRLFERIYARRPDLVIGGSDRPYLRRWYAIPRNPFFNIYLHEILRSDDDRALHDHPWPNLSVILAGRYVEHTIAAGGIHRRVERRAGAWKFRLPWSAHRLEIAAGETCRTLFITGPRLRSWGFHCLDGWRHWRDFTAGPRGETIGRGCE